MRKFLLLSLIACAAKASAQTFNPVVPDMIADPSIVNLNGTYYCYATTDGYGGGLALSGPAVVWKSKNLTDWSFDGTCFPATNGQLYWAPSKAVPSGGKYYLYPTLNTHIYVAVADKPEGPFRLVNGADTLKGPTAPKPLVYVDGPKGTKGIDAEVLVDDDGQAYMFWAQRGAAKLNKDMVSLDTAVHVIRTKRKGYSEGPIAFKRKGIYYYLYTLEGHENYKYAYGYSKTSPLGPYTYPENDIVLATDTAAHIYGPGHGCVFNEPGTDNYYFAYLEFGIGSTNRQVWVDKLEFNPDGTIRPVQLTHKGVGKAGKGLNLAAGAKATASSAMEDLIVKPIALPSLRRTETYVPANAADNSNGTRWMAIPGDTSAVFTLDLGRTKAINRTEAYFVRPTAGHAYLLEYSTDGKTWHKYGGHTDVRIQSPHLDRLAVKARYLRLSFLQGTPGLWEFKVY